MRRTWPRPGSTCSATTRCGTGLPARARVPATAPGLNRRSPPTRRPITPSRKHSIGRPTMRPSRRHCRRRVAGRALLPGSITWTRASAHPRASEHLPSDVAAEPQTGPPDAEQPSWTEPAAAAAPETGIGAAADPGSADAAEDAPRGTVPAWWNGAPVSAGPFGSAFMMPPGSPEHEADMSTGPINEPPRFRDELIKPDPSPHCQRRRGAGGGTVVGR